MGPLIESHLVPFTQIDGLNFNRGTICFKWEGINTNYCTYRCADICTRLTLSSHQVYVRPFLELFSHNGFRFVGFLFPFHVIAFCLPV
ncbi:hypothetical protein P3S67_029531 [Capsicum chacoense]